MFHIVRSVCFLISVTFCANGGVYAQTQQDALPLTSVSNAPRDISFLLQPIIVKYDIPGIVAAVISGHSIKAIGAAGVRTRSFPEKIKITDHFHIGSDTKAMTATMLACLIEKGLLKWDSKVGDVFPELKNKIDKGYESLTLEQLLTHRGGLPADVNYEHIQMAANNDLVKARQMAMEQVLQRPPEVAPETFLYSNIGYVIAGHMGEKVTGQSWEELMQNQLFLPLNMSSAGFGPPNIHNYRDQPSSHDANGKPMSKYEFADNPPMIGPAGTVHIALLDWVKFIAIHLLGAEGQSRLITLNSFRKLQTPIDNPPPSYAMGWIVADGDWAQGPVLVHAGSNTYWFAKVWIAPKRDLAILVACNQGGDNAKEACNATGLALMQEVLHLPNVTSLDPVKAHKIVKDVIKF